MKPVLSLFIMLSFLLQSFATIQAMPVREGKTAMPCSMKVKVSKKHTCCMLTDTKEKQSEKKNCCSGTSKMSCCLLLLAITPPQYLFQFIPKSKSARFFGYTESSSIYSSQIFQPPILA